jgi:dTMP kinase
LLDSRNRGLTPLAELMLYEADRAQHVEELIKPALESRVLGVSDRFFDATVVYQGFARGQDGKLILDISIKERLRALFPISRFSLIARSRWGLQGQLPARQQGQDRFEQEKIAFHRKVREGYLELARKDRKRYRLLSMQHKSVNALERRRSWSVSSLL